MSASMTFLILVIAGAVLFFAAGYLVHLLLFAGGGSAVNKLKADLENTARQLQASLGNERQLGEELAVTREELKCHQGELERLREENARMFEAPDLDSSELEIVQTPSEPPTEVSDDIDAVSQLEEEIAGLRRDLDETEKRANRTKASLDISKEENLKLKKEVRFLKKAEETAKESDKRLEELARKLKKAEGKVKEAEAKLTSVTKLEKENRYLRKEVQLLSSQTVSGKQKEAPSPSTVKLKNAFDAEMKEILQDLLAMEQVRTAVVTDASGTLVGGVGEPGDYEGLATLAGEVGRIGSDDEKKMPLKTFRTLHLKDPDDAIATFRSFTKNKETYLLATLGSNSPPGEGLLELTVGDLSDES